MFLNQLAFLNLKVSRSNRSSVKANRTYITTKWMQSSMLTYNWSIYDWYIPLFWLAYLRMGMLDFIHITVTFYFLPAMTWHFNSMQFTQQKILRHQINWNCHNFWPLSVVYSMEEIQVKRLIRAFLHFHDINCQ